MSVKCILTNQEQDISSKADQSYVEQQLGLKANKTDVATSLNLKADTSDVISKLNLKANASEVSSKNATQDAAITAAQNKADGADTKATAAQTAASEAKTTATNAQTTASNALPKAGGTMTGVINMGNRKITNLATPTADTDMANKAYVDAQINSVVEYSGWGSETEVGDQAWWSALKTWVQSASSKGLETCLGKKKKVSLSSSVLGLSSGAQVSMLCVGYNCDGPGNSLTFQTEGVLPSYTQFGSNAVWSSSCTAQNHCTNFGNYCSASQSLKSVSQQYCGATPDSTRGKLHTTYYSLICFIPSECQMGWTSSASASTSNGFGMSQDEWTEGGQHIPYQYYNSNLRRKKYQMDSSGNLTSSANAYWERSRRCNNSTTVCSVNDGGSADYGAYSATGRLAPAFVIG